jgi:hypothetical protein
VDCILSPRDPADFHPRTNPSGIASINVSGPQIFTRIRTPPRSSPGPPRP